MKVENMGVTKLKDVHTGECFEANGCCAIKTDESITEDETRYCRVVWLISGVLGVMDENEHVRVIDAKVVRG